MALARKGWQQPRAPKPQNLGGGENVPRYLLIALLRSTKPLFAADSGSCLCTVATLCVAAVSSSCSLVCCWLRRRRRRARERRERERERERGEEEERRGREPGLSVSLSISQPLGQSPPPPRAPAPERALRQPPVSRSVNQSEPLIIQQSKENATKILRSTQNGRTRRVAKSSKVWKCRSMTYGSSDICSHASLSHSCSQVYLGRPTLSFRLLSTLSVFSGERIDSLPKLLGGALNRCASSFRFLYL